MRDELLKYLKSSIDRDWLYCFDNDLVSNKERSNGTSRIEALYRLTLARLQQISSLAARQSQKLAVLIVEKNPIKFIATFLAGVITEVNLFLCDPTWQQSEWERVLKLVQPNLIYGDRSTQDTITKISSTVGNSFNQQSDLVDKSLIMIPTGGTSGKIRFAMHSWETLSASVTGFRNYFNCQKINSCCTLPLYHVSGLMQLMRSFLTQGNLVICSYKTLQATTASLDKQEYFISLVPTQLQLLIETIPSWLKEFKTVLLGGAPARRSLLDTAREYNIPIALTYGMTETASGIVTLKPEDFLAGNNSSGRVLPHGEIAIEPVDNKVGLLKISCASLCLGYYPQLFTSGQPFITDDLGYLDNEDYLHLVGRNSQKIITGGENVFPAEIEAVIYSTKLVKDVCVVGIPDSKWGQAVTAVYVPLTSEGNLNLIKQKVQSQLAKYKQPKNWVEIDTIPRNNRGKINEREIKAIALRVITNN